MINPIEHSRTKEAANNYKVEPYVVSADVYTQKNLAGRGGWTWYTGSSSWMYEAVIKYLDYDNLHFKEKYFSLLKYRILTDKDLSSYQGVDEGIDKISDVDLFAFEKTLPRSPSEYRFNAGSEFFIVKPENIIPRKPNFFEKVLDNGK